MCDAVVKLSHKNTKVHEISKVKKGHNTAFHEIFKVKKGHNFDNIIASVTELHMEVDNVNVRSCFKFKVDV